MGGAASAVVLASYLPARSARTAPGRTVFPPGAFHYFPTCQDAGLDHAPSPPSVAEKHRFRQAADGDLSPRSNRCCIVQTGTGKLRKISDRMHWCRDSCRFGCNGKPGCAMHSPSSARRHCASRRSPRPGRPSRRVERAGQSMGDGVHPSVAPDQELFLLSL